MRLVRPLQGSAEAGRVARAQRRNRRGQYPVAYGAGAAPAARIADHVEIDIGHELGLAGAVLDAARDDEQDSLSAQPPSLRVQTDRQRRHGAAITLPGPGESAFAAQKSIAEPEEQASDDDRWKQCQLQQAAPGALARRCSADH